ncbi:hypothetical protein NDU88_002599 [Pleurodeles waltl]|uniref:Uncharacterized protein n=1 Tax=Pleurodeles waltl TaxID=8319 RepID=A0AAV7T3Q8_PLEWA|nr:hypothetical protein NDU88_002599 [Pleurodeles waltl]
MAGRILVHRLHAQVAQLQVNAIQTWYGAVINLAACDTRRAYPRQNQILNVFWDGRILCRRNNGGGHILPPMKEPPRHMDGAEHALLRTKQMYYVGRNKAGRLLVHRLHAQVAQLQVNAIQTWYGAVINDEELILKEFEELYASLYAVE